MRPEARPKDLDDERLHALAGAVLDLTRRSYRSGGVTVPDSLVRELRAAGWKRRRDRFQVFARAGRPCRTCGTEIVELDQAGRRLYPVHAASRPEGSRTGQGQSLAARW